MQGFFLLSILIALVAADDDARNNKQIFSALYDRIIDQTGETFVPWPVYYPFPPIGVFTSLDKDHARWEAWGWQNRAYINNVKSGCFDYFLTTFGWNLSAAIVDPSGLYILPDVTIGPISRLPPPTDRVMFDSTVEKAGNWSAREVGWYALVTADGAYGGQKTGQTKKAGSTLACAEYYFYKIDSDLSKKGNFRTYYGKSFYPSYTILNEYNAQSLFAIVELTDEDGVPGRLWEQQAVVKNKATTGWYLYSHSHFALGPAAVKREEDKRRALGVH